MRFALVDGQLLEARPELNGICRGCGAPMVAKCGDLRVWHWAHISRRACDSRWETEGPWHRQWKELFPNEWQEQVGWDENGEKHVADLKTEHGLVVEFQHSPISQAERRAREVFYNPMFWVVNGSRRKRDPSQFTNAVDVHGNIFIKSPLIKSVPVDESALLRDWSVSAVPVQFDFGEPHIWLLFPTKLNGRVCVTKVGRAGFVRALRNGRHVNIIALSESLEELIASLPAQRLTSGVPPIARRRRRRNIETFQQYRIRKERNRRRF